MGGINGYYQVKVQYRDYTQYCYFFTQAEAEAYAKGRRDTFEHLTWRWAEGPEPFHYSIMHRSENGEESFIRKCDCTLCAVCNTKSICAKCGMCAHCHQHKERCKGCSGE